MEPIASAVIDLNFIAMASHSARMQTKKSCVCNLLPTRSPWRNNAVGLSSTPRLRCQHEHKIPRTLLFSNVKVMHTPGYRQALVSAEESHADNIVLCYQYHRGVSK